MKKMPIRMIDCFKHYTYDQDKVCTPVETVARFKKKLAEVNLDILKEVRRIDNGRLDIPVYFSLTGKDAYETIGNKKQMGKGSTPEQSQASACMELAERFSFFAFKKNADNFLRGTYQEMRASGYPLMPLKKLLQSVHDESTSLEMLEKLLEDVPMQWTWATNLNSREEVLVPFSWFFAINEFNGPSAGNTFEEAVLQGICEIVERHVCATVDYEKIAAPIIDIASIQDPVSRDLIAKFTRNGIELYLNDFTLNTGIPTVSALAIDRSTFPQLSEIVWTAGTTPNPEKALIRALTEVAQLAGDFNSGSNYIASGLPKPLSMDEVDYLAKAPTGRNCTTCRTSPMTISGSRSKTAWQPWRRSAWRFMWSTPCIPSWRCPPSTPSFPVPISGNAPGSVTLASLPPSCFSNRLKTRPNQPGV